jgi:hypothetical protein
MGNNIFTKVANINAKPAGKFIDPITHGGILPRVLKKARWGGATGAAGGMWLHQTSPKPQRPQHRGLGSEGARGAQVRHELG